MKKIELKLMLNRSRNEMRVLIVGAGAAGKMILKEMLNFPQLKYKPVGFIDDDPNKKGMFVYRFPVLGRSLNIPLIVKKHKIDQIIIAIPSANRAKIKKIIQLCEGSKAEFRILPGIWELIDGTVHLNQIRNVEIEDLLRREPVKTEAGDTLSFLSGKTVLVSGAGGSIGSELCRQICKAKPSKLVLLGKGENSIFEIRFELENKFPGQLLRACIADVRDKNRIANIFSNEKPDIVFHAAAHKHVTLMEENPEEAVLNNVLGTKNIVNAAGKYKVEAFILVSTDKAVHPISIMGATKKIAEMIVQAKSFSKYKTKFMAVRFGNVLGSRGSIVPIFKKQIAAGGPVTVSHPDVRRYFMTIPEAVQLVIAASAIGRGGEVFILDMGNPVKIMDLAKDMIRLSGFEEATDIKIKITHLKQGEKLFEEILTMNERNLTTTHQKIFISPPLKISTRELYKTICGLKRLSLQGKTADLKEKMFAFIDRINKEAG